MRPRHELHDKLSHSYFRVHCDKESSSSSKALSSVDLKVKINPGKNFRRSTAFIYTIICKIFEEDMEIDWQSNRTQMRFLC